MAEAVPMDVEDQVVADVDISVNTSSSEPQPQRSVEGYVICATNVHEEATEDDMHDLFSDFGSYRNLHLNLDRRSGYAKGYVLVEYPSFDEACAAIRALHAKPVMGRTLAVDFAFSSAAIPAHQGDRLLPL